MIRQRRLWCCHPHRSRQRTAKQNTQRTCTNLEPARVLHVIQQASWSGNQQVHAFCQSIRLDLAIRAAHDDTVCLRDRLAVTYGLGSMCAEVRGLTCM